MSKTAILIVDDNEADRYLLKRQIKETGLDVNVYEKEDGQEALEFFESYNENRERLGSDFPPLVVFLDINMPRVDGFTFLEKFEPLRLKFEIQASFIVFFSSSKREEDVERAFSYGFVRNFLTKGEFSSEELKAQIERLAEAPSPS